MALRQCCASGSLHTGTPTGRIEKVHGLDCYVADPANGTAKGIVVIVPDAFGWTFPNNRILADDIAKNGGFRVYLPEFMDGAHLSSNVLISMKALEKSGIVNQLYKFGHLLYLLQYLLPFFYYCRYNITAPRIFSFFKALKAEEARDLPVGVAGYCWGGRFVVELCQDNVKADSGASVVICGFAAHAAQANFPHALETLRLPYSYAAAEHDMAMSLTSAKQKEDILKAKTAKSRDQGIEHEFVMYSGVHHGFAVRADENEKFVAEQGKKAEAQAVSWFSKWFTDPPKSM